MTTKKTSFPRSIIIIFLITSIALILFFLKLFTPPKSETSTISPKTATSIPNYDQYIANLPRATYPSPQGTYTLQITPTTETGDIIKLTCTVQLSDFNNNSVPLPDIFNNTFECFYNSNNNQITTPFRNWINDQQFLFETQPGQITATNIETAQTNNFIYNHDQYFFSSVDNNLNHWLMQQKPIEKNLFTIVDQQFQPIIETINLQLENGSLYWVTDTGYDPVNQGFVFIIRQTFQAPGKPQPAPRLATHVKFYTPENQQLTSLYQSNLDYLQGELHCTAAKFEFQTNQITIIPGCFPLPTEDLTSDGKLVVNIR